MSYESMVSKLENFNEKTEAKLIKALSKIFVEQSCLVSEEEICLVENLIVVDQAHVCMVIAKTNRAKVILRHFYDPTKACKEPKIKFESPGNSLYSLWYVLSIMKVIQACDDVFRIQCGTDNIGIIETDDFRFLLAPRIESE